MSTPRKVGTQSRRSGRGGLRALRKNSVRPVRTTPAGAAHAPGLARDDALELAQAVIASRQQFAEAFKAAQAAGRSILEFEAIASGIRDNVGAYATAFARAATLQWLDALCLECLKRNIVDSSFIEIAVNLTDDAALAKLQRMTDPDRGFRDPGVVISRLPRALRQVCRIEISGTPRGTGFLVRPDLVMTAHHVIRELLTEDGKAAAAGSAQKLRVRFGFMRFEEAGEIQLSDGESYRVSDQWLVKTSPCTSEEYFDSLPENLELLAGFWDYAIIQLADAPGVGREGLQVASVAVRRGHRLAILQHPQASPIAWDTSVVRGFLGSGGYRILHDVNTEVGSSGSPCLNDRFEVVGLHQAGMPDRFLAGGRALTRSRGAGAAADAIKQNRAIPMGRILSEWQLKDAPRSSGATARLLTAETSKVHEHPVFGRARLQAWIARSAEDRSKGAISDRFLAVAGPKGSGKSFTVDVLRAMLPPGEHSILECRASDFDPTGSAVEFATKYLIKPLNGDESKLSQLANANTSDNAWLNYQFIGDLLTVMDTARNERMIWLVLDELNDVCTTGSGPGAQAARPVVRARGRCAVAPHLAVRSRGGPCPGVESVHVSGSARRPRRRRAGRRRQRLHDATPRQQGDAGGARLRPGPGAPRDRTSDFATRWRHQRSRSSSHGSRRDHPSRGRSQSQEKVKSDERRPLPRARGPHTGTAPGRGRRRRTAGDSAGAWSRRGCGQGDCRRAGKGGSPRVVQSEDAARYQ